MLRIIFLSILLFGMNSFNFQRVVSATTNNPILESNFYSDYYMDEDQLLFYYPSCFNVEANPFSFESCVNRNFRTAERDLDIFLSHCILMENNPYPFEACVNRNFRRIDREINTFLFSCYNLEQAPYNYQSCVNRNFRQIDRETLNEDN